MNWFDASIGLFVGVILGIGVCVCIPCIPVKVMASLKAIRHARIKSLLQFNVVWSVLMVATYTDLVVIGGFNHLRGVVIGLFVYAIVAVLALRYQRWAVAASIVVAFFVTVRFLPFFAEHFWYFLSRPDREYPSLFPDWVTASCTVTLLGLVTALPAAVLCSLYLVKLRDVRAVLRFGRASM